MPSYGLLLLAWLFRAECLDEEQQKKKGRIQKLVWCYKYKVKKCHVREYDRCYLNSMEGVTGAEKKGLATGRKHTNFLSVANRLRGDFFSSRVRNK